MSTCVYIVWYATWHEAPCARSQKEERSRTKHVAGITFALSCGELHSVGADLRIPAILCVSCRWFSERAASPREDRNRSMSKSRGARFIYQLHPFFRFGSWECVPLLRDLVYLRRHDYLAIVRLHRTPSRPPRLGRLVRSSFEGSVPGWIESRLY